MANIQVNGSDRSTVHLFHLDLPREAVDRFVTQAGTGEWPLKYGLGATDLRASFVDVVEIRDLGTMTLSKYMEDAHNATGAEFHAAKDRIDALTGHVLVLPMQAFSGVSQVLAVSTPLRWIGAFAETKAKGVGPKLRSASAAGRTGSAHGAAGRGNSSTLLKIILVGIAVVALLVLALSLR